LHKELLDYRISKQNSQYSTVGHQTLGRLLRSWLR